MNLRRSSFLVLVLTILCGCSLGDDEGLEVFSSSFDFSESQFGWTADFADYKAPDSLANKLQFSYAALPDNLSEKKALKISGINENKSLFMFIKKKLVGLSPNTEYTIVFDVKFASNAPHGLADGDSVKIKVGATTLEPLKIEQDGFYRMNIEKGAALSDGRDMVVIGTIGVNNNDHPEVFNFLVKGNGTTSSYPFVLAKTNSQGEIWLIVGTDSTFKGLTTIYYASIDLILSVPHQ